ncbi:hypothetical protein [Rhodanobacter sp. MP7CTX1]|nr:hypothetical protein [Rhodanobacter sp. MP7CTX1]MBB6189509.1 hypothetical protein [Rhodanobacter sp. MP7CTX1]
MKKIEREMLATIPAAAGASIKDSGSNNNDSIVINPAQGGGL